MTILATHNHNGTIGNTATAAGEGYDAASGTATYQAGGVTGGTIIRYPAGTVFHRDDIAGDFILFPVTPGAVTGNTTILRVATAADVSLSSIRITATGTLAAFSALSTQVDATAAGVMVAGTTCWVAAFTGSSTQEVRLYNAAGVLLDTLTGAAAAGTVGRYYVGHGHAGASTDSTDIGRVTIGDAWMAPPVTVTGAASGSFGFTGTAAGTPRTPGSAAASLGFTAAASGQARTLGTAVATFGFAGTVGGVSRKVGTASASFGGTATATGLPTVQGAAVAAFGFTAMAQGATDDPPVTGVAVAAFGFTATAAGVPRTFGTAAASFGFTATSSGAPKVIGAAVASFGGSGAANGVRRVAGAAAAALGFVAEAAGVSGELDFTAAAGHLLRSWSAGELGRTWGVGALIRNYATGAAMPLKLPHDTLEYVTVPVTADVDLTMTVQIAVGRTSDGDYTWISAGWVGAVGPERSARTTSPVDFATANYAPGRYTVYVKLTDSAEHPILEADTITVV